MWLSILIGALVVAALGALGMCLVVVLRRDLDRVPDPTSWTSRDPAP